MEKHLQIVRILTRLLDNQFQIGRFKFGLDPILGLIPGIGDVFPLLLSFYIVSIAKQMNLPQEAINRMLLNIALDFVVGLVPVVGDLSDFVFRSNVRNMEILEDYLKRPVIEGELVR